MDRKMRELSAGKGRNIVLGVVGAIVFVLLLSLGAYALSPAGKASREAVELPASTTDLTYVNTPPVNVPDIDNLEESNIMKDLLGQQVSAGAVSNDSQNGSNGNNVGNQPRQGNNNHPQAGGSRGNDGITEDTYYIADPVERTRAMNQVSNTGITVNIPSVGVKDVPYGAIDQVDHVIEPTGFGSFYAIRNMGVPYTEVSKGTTLVAAHALDLQPQGNIFSYTPSGLAVGNMLLDQEGNVRMQEGDLIQIGDRKFAYQKSERIGKGLISQRDDIWDMSVPNRLLILLCKPDSNDNIVVYATPMR